MPSDVDLMYEQLRLREQLALVTAQKEEFERLAQKRSVELSEAFDTNAELKAALGEALDELAEVKKERDQFETRLLHATEVQAIRRKKLHGKVEEIKKALTEEYAKNARLRLTRRIAESFKETKIAAQIERDAAAFERDLALAERDAAYLERDAAIAKSERNERVLTELGREGKIPSCPECGANAGWTEACCEVCSRQYAEYCDWRTRRIRAFGVVISAAENVRTSRSEDSVAELDKAIAAMAEFDKPPGRVYEPEDEQRYDQE